MDDSFDKFGSYLIRSDTTGFTSFLYMVPCEMHLLISDLASKRDNFHSIQERVWNHLNYISCTDKENLHKQKVHAIQHPGIKTSYYERATMLLKKEKEANRVYQLSKKPNQGKLLEERKNRVLIILTKNRL